MSRVLRKRPAAVRSAIAALAIAVLLAQIPGSDVASATDEERADNPQLALAERLLAVANDESQEPAERAIETARLALQARRGVVPDRLVPALDQQARNLDTTERLLELSSAEDADSLQLGIDIAKAATDWQVATLGLDLPAAKLETFGHDLLSEAALALIETKGGQATDEQLANLRDLDAQPEAIRVALTDFIDAFLTFDAATEAAYAHADRLRIETLLAEAETGSLDRAELDLTTPQNLLANLGIDFAPILAARAGLIDALAPLHDALTGAGAAQPASTGPDFQIAPYLSLELDFSEANTYGQDFMLLIDAGGHDTYLNNAGGANGLELRPAAALVDLAGNDQYRSGRPFGINGGGVAGAGFLVDTFGTDQYVAAQGGTNGGGDIGVGMLLDPVLFDNDTYSAADSGANGGGFLGGVGTLVELGGASQFAATSCGTNGGGCFAGTGFLFEGLIDAGTPNWYTATTDGTNGGGSLGGVGYLMSTLNADRYIAGSFGTNGGGHLGGNGFLFDLGGSDAYGAQGSGANGGGNAGVGTVLDADGPDSYSAASSAVNGGGNLGLGLLYDQGGTDSYSDGDGGSGTDKTVLAKGVVGSQLDNPPPSPVPTTTPTLPPTTLPIPTTVPTLPPTTLPIPTTVPTLPPTTLPSAAAVAVIGDAKVEAGALTFTIKATDTASSVSGTFSTSAPPDPLAPTVTLAATPGVDYTPVVSAPINLNGGNGFTQTVTVPVAQDADVELPESILGTFTASSGLVADDGAVGLGVILPDGDLPVPTTVPTLPPTTLPVSTTLPPTTLPVPTTLPPTTLPDTPDAAVVAGDADLEGNNLTFTVKAIADEPVSGTFSTSAPPDPLAPMVRLAATPGADYTPVASTPISLNAGNDFTQTVTVSVAQDTLVEGPEAILGTFTADSAEPVDDSATGISVILPDGDTPPLPPTTLPPTTLPVPTTLPPTTLPVPTTLPPTTLPVPTTVPPTTLPDTPDAVLVAGDADLEGADLTFTVKAIADEPVTGTFSTSAPPDPLAPTVTLAATPGVDYTPAVSVPVTLNAGNNFTQTVTVPVAQDTDVELPESILGTFTAAGPEPVDEAATGIAIILPDGDTPPLPPTTLPPTTLPVSTTLPPTTLPVPTTVPPVPPVVTVSFEDVGRCEEVKLINDTAFGGVWHSNPDTPPYSVCVVILWPVPFQVRITVDPDAINP